MDGKVRKDGRNAKKLKDKWRNLTIVRNTKKKSNYRVKIKY